MSLVNLFSKLSEDKKTSPFYLSSNKRITDGIEYTLNNIDFEKEEEALRTYATDRNNVWKKDLKSMNEIPSKIDGKINNSFYRTIVRYDIIIPKNYYETIMDYYMYCIETEHPDLKFMNKYLDHMFFFVHFLNILKGRFISHLFTKRDKTPIYCRLLASYISSHYPEIIHLLKKINVIDVDEMYIPGYRDKKAKADKKGVCRHYNFIEEKSKECLVYQITNRAIICNVHTPKKVAPPDIKLDGEQRDEKLIQYFIDNFSLSKDVDRSLDFEGYNRYFTRFHDLNNVSDYHLGRDKFGNRLHHPFLTMKKSMRKAIMIDGCMENSIIDIRNSHPYFFSLLLDENFLESAKHILMDEEYNLFKGIIENEDFADNIEIFKRIASSGNYYSFLAEKFNTTVDEMKTKNMIFFYGRIYKNFSLYKEFQKDFRFINVIKAHLTRIGGFNRLCQVLQRVESFVMIDKVFVKLMDSGFKALPMHDAFMVKNTEISTITKQMKTVFKELGVEYTPTFSTEEAIKDYTPIDAIYLEHCSKFMSNNFLFESLNHIIKERGIHNRVFREGMKAESIEYIDRRFFKEYETLPADLEAKYSELRMQMQTGQHDRFDFDKFFKEYRSANMMKKKWYGRGTYDYVRINPIEYYNHVTGNKYRTRVKESKYLY